MLLLVNSDVQSSNVVHIAGLHELCVGHRKVVCTRQGCQQKVSMRDRQYRFVKDARWIVQRWQRDTKRREEGRAGQRVADAQLIMIENENRGCS